MLAIDTHTELRCMAPHPAAPERIHRLFLKVMLPGVWVPTGRLLEEFHQGDPECVVARCHKKDCGMISEFRRVA